jgi:ABC-type glycerol-3-phosphate transport system substrate-binding protein/energy-coupling factor transporter ATP-binding protein EcfA2
MRGGSLRDVLEHGSLTTSETMAMVDQLSDALLTAHRYGVIHGDVKPDNVLLDDAGNAYLSDFGIAVGDSEIEPSCDIRGLGALVATALAAPSAEVGDVIDRAIGTADTSPYASVGDFVSDLHKAVGGGGDTNQSQAGVLMPDQPVTNPYKGLRPFDAVDAVDFFGRERLVERLIARLGLNGTRGRFVAVVGPSGSGKSSAVRAGLLPAIQRGAVPLSGSWFTIEMTPAPHPFEQLEEALLAVAVDSPPSLLEHLAGERGVQRALARVLPPDGSQLVLLIDQFEELFTQVDIATANRFVAKLVSAVTDEQSRIRVVVTLRADFYDRPLQHRALGELLREGTEIITPMNTHELERAITRPAEQHGVTFEPALLAELVREVTERSGALPLLQYTLTELFDSRRGQWLSYAAYQELGGVSGALVKRSEGLLSSLGHDADEVARQVFLRLVTLTDGGEDTRRRVLRSELEGLDVDRHLLQSVLETFGRHRLLSFDRDPVTRSPTVEISHEALLTEWTRLRDWIDGARHDVRMQRRLAEALREWIAAGRSDSYLLSGGLLEQVHGWTTTTSLQLSGAEQAFLDASIAERDREADEVRRRDERATVAERRQKQRGRQLAVVGLVALLVAAVAVFGTVQWRSAVNAKADVEDLLLVDDLVSASNAALDTDPELALLLAMQSVRETVQIGYATEEAVDAVHFALQQLGVQYDTDPETPIAVRPGPRGPVGVHALRPSELMALAGSAVQRSLTDRECHEALSGPCPNMADIPADLGLRRGFDAYAAGAGPRPLEGTTVEISSGPLRDDPGFVRQLAAFTERTGIAVELTPVEVEDTLAVDPEEPVRRPDVAVFGGVMPPWVYTHALDIGRFIDPETMRSDFGEFLLGFGRSDSVASAPAEDARVRAVPLKVEPKGLVFYPKAEFEASGYDVPTTWDELIALSDRIVADGRTPWCFAFESGEASGWPGTDLLESLVIRVGGVDVYDAWTRGDLGFASPAVMEAGRLADTLTFQPQYVRGGAARISRENFSTQLDFMLARDNATGETEPECWLYHQAHFLLNLAPTTTEIGTDLDFFMLPPLEAEQSTPVTGSAPSAAALVDRPEVRAFMEFAASPEWGEDWALDPTSLFTSPNRRFDPSNYGDASVHPLAAVRTRLAGVVESALQSDAFRLDASDQMPAAIGGSTGIGRGAFLQGMLDWVDGTRTIDQVFTDIDADWAGLKAAA